MQFTKITATDAQYAALKEQLSTLNDRFDYDGLAAYYGTVAVGDIIPFEYPKGKTSVVGKNLEKRGLMRNVDFSLESAIVGEGDAAKNQVFLTRQTDKAPQKIEVKARGRKPKAEGDTAAPVPATGAPAAAAAPATKAAAKK